MKYVASVVLGLMGLVAVAVAAEAAHRGQIWYRPRRRPWREARWLRRESEPVAFWSYAGVLGVLGLVSLALGGLVLFSR